MVSNEIPQNKYTHCVFTVPNILSMFRILLIPVFVVFFFADTLDNHYIFAALTFGVSGFSDIVDGFIARRWKMISNFGKIIDPIADKLTQAAVLICLACVRSLIIPLVILLFTKELLMLIGAIVLLRRGTRPTEAKWWGKMSTVILFASIILFLLDSLWSFLPDWSVITLVAVAGVSILFSLFNYYPLFRENLRKAHQTGS